jgi:hypothetical protein
MRPCAEVKAIIKEHILNRINDEAKKIPFYEKLLRWRKELAWHFGNGISDDYIFDTGENWVSL